MSGARFERALIVDWSGAATPTLGADSCWVASGRLDRPGPVRTVNHPTRQATMAALRRAIDASLAAGERTLIAIDVSLGLAAGCAATLGLPGRPPWRALWRGLAERIEDDAHNANNRFAAADAMNADCGTRVFWGRPVGGRWEELVHLPHRDVDVAGLAPMPLARLRACEELAGPGVLSSWMLSGRGSVGGQVLTCLPHLERMRQDLGDQLAVWPFEGPGDPGHPVVLAETWFGLWDWSSERRRVRDAQQVAGTLKALRALGPRGLAALLDPPSLTGLTSRRRREVLGEEGWTLGVA